MRIFLIMKPNENCRLLLFFLPLAHTNEPQVEPLQNKFVAEDTSNYSIHLQLLHHRGHLSRDTRVVAHLSNNQSIKFFGQNQKMFLKNVKKHRS